MATTSTVAELLALGPRAVVPVVIRTRAICSPALATAPRKPRLPDTDEARALRLRSGLPLMPKNWIDVVSTRLTSVKTAPKPLTVAGIPPEPGMEKVTSVMLLPIGEKSRRGLKVLKMVL